MKADLLAPKYSLEYLGASKSFIIEKPFISIKITNFAKLWCVSM
jgi:hypothetical protein